MGACHSRDATEPPTSNMQAVPTKSVDATQSPATIQPNKQAVVPMYIPPVGAWTPEREEEKRRAKIAEIQRQNEIEIKRATSHLKQKSSSKDRRSSRHHRTSTSLQMDKPAIESTTQRSPADNEQSVMPSSKPEAELSTPTGAHASPSGSVLRQLSSPATPDDAIIRRGRAGSHQSVTPSLTRESSRVECRSSNDKPARKEWNYESMPGERGDLVRLRSQSSRHGPSQSISHPISAPSTPPVPPRRATFGESTLHTVAEPAADELSVSTPRSVISNNTTPIKSSSNEQSPNIHGVRLRSAPVTPRNAASAAPRVQSVSPTAADASAMWGVKLRRTPASPSSHTPATAVTVSVA